MTALAARAPAALVLCLIVGACAGAAGEQFSSPSLRAYGTENAGAPAARGFPPGDYPGPALRGSPGGGGGGDGGM